MKYHLLSHMLACVKAGLSDRLCCAKWESSRPISLLYPYIPGRSKRRMAGKDVCRLGKRSGFQLSLLLGAHALGCAAQGASAHLARLAQNSVGTKHFDTRLLNHRLLHVVKSVTTVAKWMGSWRRSRMRRRSTRNGTCCISGCTEITRSGSYVSNLHGTRVGEMGRARLGARAASAGAPG